MTGLSRIGSTIGQMSDAPAPDTPSAALQTAAAVLAAAEHAAARDGWLPHPAATAADPPGPLVQAWTERLHAAAATVPGFSVVSPCDGGYPRGLLDLADAPSVLFVSGEQAALSQRCVAIVGSRAAPPEALAAAEAIASAVAAAGAVVVSGMAAGVDTAAHWGALRGGGSTVAVLGTGVGVVYPPENRGLHDRIAAAGAVVSQFPPGQQPSRTSFLARNAVIAAMGEASVAVAATERSGTRNEISHASALGRPVLLWGPQLGGERWARDLAASEDSVCMVDTVEEAVARCGL